MNKDINIFKVVIVDAYGVFNFGAGISKSVIATFQKWMEAGKQVYILSNTTAVNSDAIKSYEKKGVIKGIHYTDMMTSGQFASEDIQAGNLPVSGKKYYVFGTANFKKPEDKVPAIFIGSTYKLTSKLHEADFIYCGVPQLLDNEFCPYDSTNIEDFQLQVKLLVESGKPLVCANPDLTANERGSFVIRQGSIARLFEEMGGKVIYYGKPDPRIFNALLDRYCPNISKNDVLMIGDTLRTDIKGALQAGIKSALVIEGGVTEHEMKQNGLSLAEYIRQENVVPYYVWDRVSEDPLF